MTFRKAERKKARLRLGIVGPAGSGKTYSALQVAMGLGGKIALIDTENHSGELYSHLTDYDVCEMDPPFTVQRYLQAIDEAQKAGYEVLIIDSLSHAWFGQGGILEQVDNRRGKGNDFAAWRDVTPLHNKLVDAILQAKCHVIVTMRTKTAYDMEKDEKTGKVKPVKVGLAPVQREGLDYEFDVVFDIDQQKHMAQASKDRTSMFDGQVFVITKETGEALKSWLESGTEAPAKVEEAPVPAGIAAKRRELFLAVKGMSKEDILKLCSEAVGREIKNSTELTEEDIDKVLEFQRGQISE